MTLQTMGKGLLSSNAGHTPEIVMSLSQRLHVLADPIAALITEMRVIKIQETAGEDFLY